MIVKPDDERCVVKALKSWKERCNAEPEDEVFRASLTHVAG